jgi:glycosyltransferase involved in cell wall biosynthesis
VSALVTAIIPTYNYARFVSRAIESVLAQTYAPIECVVIDDGSTDETPDVLARHGARIRAIRQENGGLSAARNAGIAAARGEYVALLDADDWWAPEKIAKQVARIAREPSVAAVGCGQRVVDADMLVLHTVIHRDPGTDRAENLRAVALRKLWVGGSGSGLLAKRSVLESVGPFDTSLRAAEDWDMWLRLFAHHEVRNLPEVLVSLHSHGTGSFRNATLMEENQRRVAARAIERWPDVLGPLTRRQMHALILADAALERMDTPDVACARKKMAASLRLWPIDPFRVRVLLSLTARATRASLSR